MYKSRNSDGKVRISAVAATGNKGAFCVDDDKLFHTRGPATQNARLPMVVCRTLRMPSLAEAEDRSLLCEYKAATGCSWSTRYTILTLRYSEGGWKKITLQAFKPTDKDDNN